MCILYVFLQATGTKKIRKDTPEHVESPPKKGPKKGPKKAVKYLCLQLVSAILTCCVFGNRRTPTREAAQKADTEIPCALPCVL